MAHDRSAETYPPLLSLAVHEFRTPASVVGGYLRMLQREVDSPLSARQQKMVEEAEKACGRIVGLISELSEVSKIDAGSAIFADERFDVFQLISDVAKEMHEAVEREVHLEPSGDTAGAPITGDRNRMAAAFSAFFRAILREQPYAVTIVAERRIVTEEGSASAMVLIAREHDVQQSYKSTRSPFDELRGGLGLALPVARRVIERHGGRVWALDLSGGDPSQGRQAIAISLPISLEPRC
jgi:signal transduction histidine kinase